MRGLGAGSLLPLLLAAAAGAVPAFPRLSECPERCSCQIRPWYSPRSVYREAATVDCNDLSLRSVPRELPPATHTLLLQGNDISGLERGELGYLRNLSELDLSRNAFSDARDLGLGDPLRLLSLHLEENRLAELPDGSFPGLGELQELYLNHNRIRSIAPRAFAGLSGLLRLHLDSNRLRSVDSRWFQALPGLEVLMMGGNRVDAIVDMNFRPLGNLRSLALAGMRLREVADFALEGLRSLESLSFYDNRLAEVPKRALRRVPGLKFLDLTKNPLQRVKRSDFSDMLHLKELGLTNMAELVSIDRLALADLPELTKLDASNNPKLSFVHPEAFARLPRLETLLLNNNALSALHGSALEALPGLREIGIHGNPLRCDCVLRRLRGAGSRVRFLEPRSTLCSEPPELRLRRVRDIPAGAMTERCLPHIPAASFPARLEAEAGRDVELHCRALAEPEPEIYWVTPDGIKLPAEGGSGKYAAHPEGTLEIRGAAERDAGLYTCVAHNLLGAATRSVRLLVGRSSPAAPAGPQLEVLESQPYHVLLAWEPGPAAAAWNLTWAAAEEEEEGSRREAARIPAGMRRFRITRLRPGTEYRACLRAAAPGAPGRAACVRARTKEAAAGAAFPWGFGVLGMAALLGAALAAAGMGEREGSGKRGGVRVVYPAHPGLERPRERLVAVEVQEEPAGC